MNSKPPLNYSPTVHLANTTMSHTIIATNSIKINKHIKTRSVFHHRSHQSRQTKPDPIKHFTAIPTAEHRTHDPPTRHTTPRINRACANHLNNVNKASVIDYTSAHLHPTQQLNTPSTQYSATLAHTAHSPPTQNTPLYHLFCDCAERHTHIKTNKTTIIIVLYYHERYIIVNLIYSLTYLTNRRICSPSFNTRYNAKPEKRNYTGNLSYEKVYVTTTKAGIKTQNGK